MRFLSFAHGMMPIMAPQFGHIDGHPVGTSYVSRARLHGAGLHSQLRAGISGTAGEGADAIVLSAGGYSDDEDYGDIIIYTGHGGRDSESKRQVRDQNLADRGNAALARNELEGLYVRVIRGADKGSQYAPNTGYRYDGLYRVESHSAKIGIDGFLVWQFRLEKLIDSEVLAEQDAVVELPEDNKIGSSPVTTSVIQRIVRSSAVVRQVKDWYAHCCQVCGKTIEVNGGFYSEGAHIQALGRPHYGPDVVENVLCLCPNDHVRFDVGAIYLSEDLQVINGLNGEVSGPLRVHDDHRIGLGYVAQHRDRWTKGTAQTRRRPDWRP
ncbi:YDG/SRA domain-containing protein [Streptosporangium sp. NPDC005286]|uniref:YDG/SRA domain-containing protein n=1 Tax=Streptosporangium sp. NPDC005286 TaxID=3154463 RepID=UPI0033A1C314